jgi:hypothetical protein
MRAISSQGDDMKITYVRVVETSPEVVALAKSSGFGAKEVCAMINNGRYRAGYNKEKQARDKVVRQWVKEHPGVVDGSEQA